MDPLKAHLNPNSKAINQANVAFQKESIINLQNYMDKEIRIKFNGGREITGILKEYDTSLNMIIDNCFEFLRDNNDMYKTTDKKRFLGLCVIRGSMFLSICLANGFEEIENPFGVIE